MSTVEYAGVEATESNVLLVTASVPGDGGRDAPALAELAVLALRAVGERARAVPPPPACRPPAAADAPLCRRAVRTELERGTLHVAFLTVPAAVAFSAHSLHDHGLDELGDVAPPGHRLCVSGAPALSLLDLSNSKSAQNYHISSKELTQALNKTSETKDYSQNTSIYQPDWCAASDAMCASLLTSDEGEASVLMNIISQHGLYVNVHVLGAALSDVAAELGARTLICDWNPERANLSGHTLHTLGPTPCDDFSDADRCPFESRRFMKLVNARALARSHSALMALLQLRIQSRELYELTQLAKFHDAKTAALMFVHRHPLKALISEIRVAVLLPATTTRETYDGISLAAAGALAEADLEKDWSGIRFKVNKHMMLKIN